MQYSPDFSNEIYVKIKNNVFKEKNSDEFISFVNTFQKSNKNKIKSAYLSEDSENDDENAIEWSLNFPKPKKQYPYKYDYSTPILIFHPLKNSESHIAYYNCADFRKLILLKEVYNITMIISSIERKEYQEQIQFSVMKNNIVYEKVIFDIISDNNNDDSSNNDKDAKLDKITGCILYIYDKLKMGKHNVLIHSASGTQRSNMIIYCLLRLNGEHKDDARVFMERLKMLRRNRIGDYSLQFAELKLIPRLLKIPIIKENDDEKISNSTNTLVHLPITPNNANKDVKILFNKLSTDNNQNINIGINEKDIDNKFVTGKFFSK